MTHSSPSSIAKYLVLAVAGLAIAYLAGREHVKYELRTAVRTAFGDGSEQDREAKASEGPADVGAPRDSGLSNADVCAEGAIMAGKVAEEMADMGLAEWREWTKIERAKLPPVDDPFVEAFVAGVTKHAMSAYGMRDTLRMAGKPLAGHAESSYLALCLRIGPERVGNI